jgi:hypothetical protein
MGENCDDPTRLEDKEHAYQVRAALRTVAAVPVK